ncbi:hypothetical protein FVE85_5014 [Porphyridium purpureum]|uniref:DUF4203 domain-containing protein n=1 Tax=Porphyridium purpureum TaxID=35688 RepID=A0A5J4YTY9_PORPP|nr:hypothetical protein FVE85_5014 [Porphyridium purpureum]|eukprot:POR6502..scf236_6
MAHYREILFLVPVALAGVAVLALQVGAASTWLPVFVLSWLPVLLGSRVVTASLFLLPFWSVAVLAYEACLKYIQPSPTWLQALGMLAGVVAMGVAAGALSVFFLSDLVALLLGLSAGCIGVYILLGCSVLYVQTHEQHAQHADFLEQNGANWMALATFVMGICGASVALLVYKYPRFRPYTTIAIGAFGVCYGAAQLFNVPYDVPSMLLKPSPRAETRPNPEQWVWTFALSVGAFVLFLIGTALEIRRNRNQDQRRRHAQGNTEADALLQVNSSNTNP